MASLGLYCILNELMFILLSDILMVFILLFVQTIVRESSEPFDFVRTSRMAGYGIVILGPSLHFWFNFVSKLFPRRDLFSTLKKMVMGQTLYGPAMTVIFFSLNARLQGMFNSLSIIFIMLLFAWPCISNYHANKSGLQHKKG